MIASRAIGSQQRPEQTAFRFERLCVCEKLNPIPGVKLKN